MMVKTALVLLALPMAAAKMRGAKIDKDTFHRRMKGDDMDGGDMGGMGSDGCPDPDDAPEILCRSNADCIGSPFCSNPDDCCCVAYTYSYCGSPSSCNQFLQCLPDNSPDVVPAPFSVGAVGEAFGLLSTVSQCLADAVDGDDSADMPAMDSEDMPMMDSEDIVFAKSTKKGSRKGTKKLGNKVGTTSKKMKQMKRSAGDDKSGMKMVMSSEDN